VQLEYLLDDPNARDSVRDILDAGVSDAMGGHGAEWINGSDTKNGRGFWYVNMGDPYRPTIAASEHGNVRVLRSGWGDLIRS
jgi:hypothetical protein